MKFVSPSYFADPDAAARKLVQIANAVEAVQDGRIYIELINSPFLRRAARRTSTEPRSRERSRWAGCSCTNPEPMVKFTPAAQLISDCCVVVSLSRCGMRQSSSPSRPWPNAPPAAGSSKADCLWEQPPCLIKKNPGSNLARR